MTRKLKVHGTTGYRVPGTGESITFCGKDYDYLTKTTELEKVTCIACQKFAAKHTTYIEYMRGT